MYPNVSYYTYYGPIRAAVSNTTDLLDLLDAFDTGELFTAERVPGPEHFLGARIFDGSVHGYGLPFNGYCPCESAGAGNGLDVATIGRQPSSVGQSLFMLRYPDGVSIVLHFNSGDEADRGDTRAVVEGSTLGAVTAGGGHWVANLRYTGTRSDGSEGFRCGGRASLLARPERHELGRTERASEASEREAETQLPK